MAFARKKEEVLATQSKTRLSNILETFLDSKTQIKRASLHKSRGNHSKIIENSHSIEKKPENIKKNCYFSVSLTDSKQKKVKSGSSFIQSHQNNGSIDKRKVTTEQDEFVYLDQIKRKIEKSLSNTGVDSQIIDHKFNNQEGDSFEENNTSKMQNNGYSQDLMHQLQLKEAVHRQEIAKLKASNEKLMKKNKELEEIISKINNSKEKESKAFNVLERELSTEKHKTQQLESKLKKINPIKTAQLFQEILIKNECLIKEKEELEELLKQMLLDKEIQKLKNPQIMNMVKPAANFEPLFKENEAQKPYEILETHEGESNKVKSSCPVYKYFNENDSTVKKQAPHYIVQESLYEKLGEFEGVSQVVDLFYKKVLADRRVIGFYNGVDMQILHKNQKNFLCKVFGGPDRYTGRTLADSHQKLFISNYHFDIVKEHLIDSMQELLVPKELISQVEQIFEGARNDIVNPEINPRNEKENAQENMFKTNYTKKNETIVKKQINQVMVQKTLFEKIGESEAVSKAVDLFYRKVLADRRVVGFYNGVDMQMLHKNQKNFLCKVFGGPDRYTGRTLADSHQKLFISNYHFDIVKGHLINALQELHVPEEQIFEVGQIFEGARNDIVNPEIKPRNEQQENLQGVASREKSSTTFAQVKPEEKNKMNSKFNLIRKENNYHAIKEKKELSQDVLYNNTSDLLYKASNVSEEDSVRFLHEMHSSSQQRFEQSLYLRLGGFDKITSLVERFYEIQKNDSRINGLYQEADFIRLQHNLKYFLTKVFGGPDIFIGDSLKDCDSSMNHSLEYFNISIENFRKAAEMNSIYPEMISAMITILYEKKNISFTQSNPHSLYELIGGYKSVASLVESFYNKLNEEFFVDLKEEFERMKQTQKFYITKILGGPDTFLGESTCNFWRDPWLVRFGENKWLELLGTCLEKNDINGDSKNKIIKIFSKEIQK